MIAEKTGEPPNAGAAAVKYPSVVEKIARAVLYEGYMLYPYRHSAWKNRRRWNFGVLFPEACGAVQAGHERSAMQIECLVRGHSKTGVRVNLRFLHLVSGYADPSREPASAGESAIEREFHAPAINLGRLSAAPVALRAEFAPAKDIPMRQETVVSGLDLSAVQLGDRLFKLTAQPRNLTPIPQGNLDRDSALTRSLLSAHLVLQVTHGEFLSLIDPPLEHRQAAAACCNVGAWPVLVGDEGQRDWMLASAIILYDYPQVAPESAGDFFDGTEIDELLTLRILTLTDQEKHEIRSSDPRAREILERTERLPPEYLMKLHGALRGVRETKRQK